MFCNNCGREIKDTVKCCPYCGKSVEEDSAEVNKGKKKKKAKKIIVVVLSLILVLSVFLLLEYLDILHTPLSNKILNQITKLDNKIKYKCNDGEEIIYNPLSEENISDVNGLKYVNNEILVYLDSSGSEKQLGEYLNNIDAKIVGQIPQINQYQIQLNGEKSLEEIQKIISDMKQISWINHVGVNYVIETVEEFYPNDKEWKKSWKDQSGGKNWGMEAIKAPEAWEYKNQMNPVNVGVFDAVFDTDHEDLKDVFVEEPLLNFSSKENKEEDQSHGTHVAGTIAAGFNNEIGVCGVCPTARLYGVAYNSKLKKKYTTSQFFNIGFTYLITNNCKVINMSLTPTNRAFNFSASRGNEYANTIINKISDEMGYYLDIMIKKGYKFVICNSSGNLNEANGGFHFYRKEKFDDKKELSYYDDNDYKSYKNGTADETVKKYFDKYTETRVESGNVDAKYNSICAIKNKNVQDIIITVGAIEPNEKDKKGNIQNYRESAYSQGGEAVDVVAPGGSTSIKKDAIYSTIPGGYGYSPGTSMSTPHVSGVAAMLFAIDPNIEPSKVKKIIVETSSGEYGNGEHKYGLVDANAAVTEAIKGKNAKENNKDEQQNIANIPEDAVEFNGHKYCIYKGAHSYEEASEFCKSQSGYLATITSKEENDFLFSYMKQKGYESTYFGFSDTKIEGDWQWENDEEVDFTNWHKDEPNDGNTNEEDYAMFYYKYDDGTWNDGDFGKNTLKDYGNDNDKEVVFICEWGDFKKQKPQISKQQNIILTLDASGSMSGTSIEETKKASNKFIDTVLQADAGIGLVTYSAEASIKSGISKTKSKLHKEVDKCGAIGGTNIEAGLKEATKMLEKTDSKKKTIVLMSDGEPNEGLTEDALVEYAEEIKKSGINIYTIGFFSDLSQKTDAQILMEKLSSPGCHYEVANAEGLTNFFNDIADQINGQKYIYIKVACPVDVSVSYGGETLDSSKNSVEGRTEFGTLTYEENPDENTEEVDDKNKVKIMRLKEGPEYDIKIIGTGQGVMNYTIGFMNENGEYDDFRKFTNVRITSNTEIDTVANISEQSMLKIDEDGDGKYDLKLAAKKNSRGEVVKNTLFFVYICVGISIALALFLIIYIIRIIKKRN